MYSFLQKTDLYMDCHSTVLHSLYNVRLYSSLCTLHSPGSTQSLYNVQFSKIDRLKEQCHEIFCFMFFSWIMFPQAPKNSIRVYLNFVENSRKYSQVKVRHRYRWCFWYRWQIMGTISDWRHLKVNLKEKYLCVNSTTQRFFKIFFGGIFIFFFVLYEKKGVLKK
jgi:hypothetical protein